MTIDRETWLKCVNEERLLKEPDGDRTLYYCPYCGRNGHIFWQMAEHLDCCRMHYFYDDYDDKYKRKRDENGLYIE